MASIPDQQEEESQLIPLSPVEIQQDYYVAVGDVDWELYEEEDRKYLLQKVAIALCGPPETEGDLVSKDDELKLQGYKLRQEDFTMSVYNKILEQAKYSHNGKNILISVLRIVCVAPSEEIPFYKPYPDDYWQDLHLKRGEEINLNIFHVFCIRKCISMKAQVKGCKIYIDHEARVYQNWDDYLEHNNLPKSVMVVPANGEYRGIIENDPEAIPAVILQVLPTPALGAGARVLSVFDKTSIVANVGALAGVVGALAFPVVAPVALGTALGVGAVTGVYGIVRSSINLTDRSKHEQSIGLENSEARANWLNITLSTVGLSFGAAGKFLSMSARAGASTTEILANAFQILKYANLMTGFVGVANSLGEMLTKYYRYGENPTTMELFQFTSSVFFFGLGVMSNQTAQEIIQDAQATKINNIRDTLTSNRQRRMFDKVTAETRRVKGTIDGNADVIRALKKIDNKEQFFSSLAKVNKNLNKNKVRISLSPEGSIKFNNQHNMKISDLLALGKQKQNILFSEYGPSKLTSPNAPTRIYPSNVSAQGGSTVVNKNEFFIRSEELIKISTFLIKFSQMALEEIAEILEQISRVSHEAFMILCADFLSHLVQYSPVIFNSLGINKYLILVRFVFRYLSEYKPFGECDYNNDYGIVIVLKEFFQDGCVKKETILLLASRFSEWLNDDSKPKEKKIDELYKYCMQNKAFKKLQSGEVVKIGSYSVLVKCSTEEKLTTWMEKFNQEQCDMIMHLCYNIIKVLPDDIIAKLSLINPDEDIILRVVQFILKNCESTDSHLKQLLEQYSQTEQNFNVIDIILEFAKKLRDWLSKQSLRKSHTCETCNGLCYTLS